MKHNKLLNRSYRTYFLKTKKLTFLSLLIIIFILGGLAYLVAITENENLKFAFESVCSPFIIALVLLEFEYNSGETDEYNNKIKSVPNKKTEK